MDILFNITDRTLLVEIKAEEKLCNAYCPFFSVFRTGLVGEWHPRCDLFNESGKWREYTMKRNKQCLKAEKAAAKR